MSEAKRPVGRPPNVDGPSRNRGLGRMRDERWEALQEAASLVGIGFSGWAIGVLEREAKKILKKDSQK